ncbi:MAG: DNA integrity scanning protein DisA [Firmicutes bacterium]|nr:DNA integrity scanning protein DisA [Bacillota bacterium]
MKAKLDEFWSKTLPLVAPGTALSEGLENILRARTGALIVVGDSEETLSLVNGGFRIDAEMNPTALYELAKMDGAIILSFDAKRILYANCQLTPDPMIPTFETGTRHRTAERVAKQTGELVISISQRRNVISLYKGNVKHVLRDVGVILAKVNQALQTLEKYKSVLQQVLTNLTALEFEGAATLADVTMAVQRAQMVERVANEIERYIIELGTEGRLVSMQLEELMVDIEDEGYLVIKDYLTSDREETAEQVWQSLSSWESEDLLDQALTARALGYGSNMNNPDYPVVPRGYRVVSRIPRLPMPVIENLVNTFKELPNILQASIDELDDVEGIGEVRAKAIREGLRRMREQVLLDRHI